MLMGPVDQEFGKDSGDGLSMFHDYCNFSWESLEAGDGSLSGPGIIQSFLPSQDWQGLAAA